jgi:colicin import membrane protein
MSFVAQHKAAIVWSVLLHGTAAAALLLTFKLPARPLAPVPAAPIQGVMIDQAALERQEQEREQAAQRERDRARREQRERREAVERQQAAERQQKERQLAVERQERERREEAERQRVATEKREQERVAAEKREQEQRQQEQREREARERREAEEAAKREAAAAEQRRRQQQAERELQEALAAERATADAVAAGQLDQYMLLIQSRVKQFWVRPLSARPGVDCVVRVTQLPTGDVTDAVTVSCNGDEAVRRSIEKAVRDASPLPRAPSQAVFSRTFTIRFQPDK